MKLIVNADDFGMSKGVNYGIIDAHKNGIVTSTTLMVTMPEVLHARKLSKENPSLKIGLHLNITFGKPLTNGKSLVDDENNFIKPNKRLETQEFIEEEVYAELDAQVKLFMEIMGRKPSHMDSHLYAHQIYSVVQKAAIRVAEKYDIALRGVKTKGYKEVIFLDWFKLKDKSICDEEFLEFIKKSKDSACCELMVHPAYVDEFLINYSQYNMPRAEEVKILCKDTIKKIITDLGIDLISYEDVRS